MSLLNAAVKTFALSKFFVKCLVTYCVGSVINVKIDVNLQDMITKVSRLFVNFNIYNRPDKGGS